MSYFPGIDLDATALAGLLCLFEGVELLQPVFAVSTSQTEEAQRRGWVSIRQPLAVDLDARRAKAFLHEYERLVGLYQDSGYLDYLKHAGARGLEDETGYGLIREIRRYGQDLGPPDGEETLRGQLLLQIAQDLDRQRREIQEALGELRIQERSLLLNLGPDREEDDPLAWEEGPLPTPDEDDLLIPQRLRAWGEMRGAAPEASPHVLLTDNPLVMEHLLGRGSGEHAQGHLDPVGLLRIQVPRFSPADPGETARIREAIFPRLTWRIFCEQFESLLRLVKETPWSEATLRDLLARGMALSAYFTETVLDEVVESVTALEPSWGRGWQEGTLTLMFFPGHSETGLLKGSPKEASPDLAARTLVLFLQDRAALPSPGEGRA